MEQQLTVSLSQTSGIICAKCKFQFFEEGLILRKVSRFITGASADSVMPVPVLMCKNCGTVCNDTLAPELQEMFKQDADTIIPTEETTSGTLVKMNPDGSRN